MLACWHLHINFYQQGDYLYDYEQAALLRKGPTPTAEALDDFFGEIIDDLSEQQHERATSGLVSEMMRLESRET